jgi:hypothetical protein
MMGTLTLRQKLISLRTSINDTSCIGQAKPHISPAPAEKPKRTSCGKGTAAYPNYSWSYSQQAANTNLRGSDNYGTGDACGLEVLDGREVLIAGAGGRVNNHVVQVAPVHVLEELLDHACKPRPPTQPPGHLNSHYLLYLHIQNKLPQRSRRHSQKLA